jgi:hypothetical protein
MRVVAPEASPMAAPRPCGEARDHGRRPTFPPPTGTAPVPASRSSGPHRQSPTSGHPPRGSTRPRLLVGALRPLPHPFGPDASSAPAPSGRRRAARPVSLSLPALPRSSGPVWPWLSCGQAAGRWRLRTEGGQQPHRSPAPGVVATAGPSRQRRPWRGSPPDWGRQPRPSTPRPPLGSSRERYAHSGTAPSTPRTTHTRSRTACPWSTGRRPSGRRVAGGDQSAPAPHPGASRGGRVQGGVPASSRRAASRVPGSGGLSTPAARPRVRGCLAPGVRWRLRPPGPRGPAGDPLFPGRQMCRARRRGLVRLLQGGRSAAPTGRPVQTATTLPPEHGDPARRRGPRRLDAAIAGDCGVGRVALTGSRGSCSARSSTPSALRRFPGMRVCRQACACR